jgi:predicted MFS family arabinose efflux permease
MIDWTGWRAAFVVPGAASVLIGIAYSVFVIRARKSDAATTAPATATTEAPAVGRRVLARLFAIIFFSTAVGGLIFQSTTFSLPKVFDERLGDIAGSASLIGWYAFVVFAVAAFAQLVVGYLVDRHSVRRVFAVVAGLQAVFFAAMVQLTGVAALVVSIAFMLVVFGQIPINDVLVGRATKSAWRSRVFALRYVVTFSTAAAAVPLIAWIHARGGFSTLFLVLSAAAAAIFFAVLMLPRSRHTVGAAAKTTPAE